MSQFMAQELLHDYVNNNLDAQRHEAVEQALEKYPSLKKDLEHLKAGSAYCEKLSATQVGVELVESLSKHESFSTKALGVLSWSRWPDTLKWTTEAVLLSGMVVAFSLVAPWDKVSNWLQWSPPNSAVLAERAQERAEEKLAVAEPAMTEPTPVKEAVPTPSVAPAPTLAPTVAPTPTPEIQKAPQGTLHRMMMKVPNIKSRASEVSTLIRGLGGKKAGQVKLGWEKTNGSYYHFSIPEKNKEKLRAALREYGSIRSYKYPHQRVMPEGVMRIILFIEEVPVEAPLEPSEVEAGSGAEAEAKAEAEAGETPEE